MVVAKSSITCEVNYKPNNCSAACVIFILQNINIEEERQKSSEGNAIVVYLKSGARASDLQRQLLVRVAVAALVREGTKLHKEKGL